MKSQELIEELLEELIKNLHVINVEIGICEMELNDCDDLTELFGDGAEYLALKSTRNNIASRINMLMWVLDIDPEDIEEPDHLDNLN